ncbi:hypothetical protein AAG570_006396 [Ranatra chinensis]|uniref:Serine protease n=1 Tax=Ranatra chinensis TaxID=642074 RepID=A0ABD0YTY9_9HEMI
MNGCIYTGVWKDGSLLLTANYAISTTDHRALIFGQESTRRGTVQWISANTPITVSNRVTLVRYVCLAGTGTENKKTPREAGGGRKVIIAKVIAETWKSSSLSLVRDLRTTADIDIRPTRIYDEDPVQQPPTYHANAAIIHNVALDTGSRKPNSRHGRFGSNSLSLAAGHRVAACVEEPVEEAARLAHISSPEHRHPPLMHGGASGAMMGMKMKSGVMMMMTEAGWTDDTAPKDS